MTIRGSVTSPYVGVTARSGMIILWGSARYDYNTDNIKWEWEKR